MTSANVVMFSGDRLPPLRVVTCDQVRVGHTYWGAQDRNPRKGWFLEAEGAPITTMPRLLEMGEFYTIGSRMIRHDVHVLVEDTRRMEELAAHIRLIRERMDADTDHRAFCVVNNGLVLDLLATLDRLLGAGEAP